jgi:hypothetical protein
MALIIFHAGMSKAGSTSLQGWLAENLALLRSRGIESMRIEQRTPADPIAVVRSTRENATSKFLPAARDRATRPEVARRICEQLDAQAAHADALVVSSESYEVFFNDGSDVSGVPTALGHLDELARAHTVRIAYYVRPQHSWLESAWLQWGFRDSRPPDLWLRHQRSRLMYLRIFDAVRQVAPHLSFEMRPFRPDLLEGGHVVSDFVRVFLGLRDLPPTETRERWSNRSIPLEMAILLRGAPLGMFWSNMHDNNIFYPLKKLILQWELPPTDIAARSREILQAYAHATFESDNQQLIRQLGWETEYFVPPTEGGADPSGAGLAELNDLWRSAVSDGERQILFAALKQLLTTTADGLATRPRSSGRWSAYLRPRS